MKLNANKRINATERLTAAKKYTTTKDVSGLHQTKYVPKWFADVLDYLREDQDLDNLVIIPSYDHVQGVTFPKNTYVILTRETYAELTKRGVELTVYYTPKGTHFSFLCVKPVKSFILWDNFLEVSGVEATIKVR